MCPCVHACGLMEDKVLLCLFPQFILLKLLSCGDQTLLGPLMPGLGLEFRSWDSNVIPQQ